MQELSYIQLLYLFKMLSDDCRLVELSLGKTKPLLVPLLKAKMKKTLLCILTTQAG